MFFHSVVKEEGEQFAGFESCCSPCLYTGPREVTLFSTELKG